MDPDDQSFHSRGAVVGPVAAVVTVAAMSATSGPVMCGVMWQ